MRFEYFDSGFYDRAERENYGFAKVRTTREDGSTVTVHYHNQNYYLKGLPRQVEMRGPSLPETPSEPGMLFTVEVNRYRAPPDQATLTGSAFPAAEAQAKLFYEGLSADVTQFRKHTVETRVHDAFGNLENVLMRADAGVGDDLNYAIHYRQDLNRHIFRADSVVATDNANNRLRERSATYDPTTGALKTLTNVVRGGINPDTGLPYQGNATTNSTWTFAQDAFGNIRQVIDPKGLTLEYEYDDLMEAYRTVTRNASPGFGYVSSTTPNYYFGAVETETDINDYTIHYRFDEFGRLVEVFGPYDPVASGSPTLAFDYHAPILVADADEPVRLAQPAAARARHKDVLHPDDPLVTVSFVDGLDRVIQTKKDLELDNGSGQSTTVGMTVTGPLEFDARGRVARQGQAVFQALSAPSHTDVSNATLLHETSLKHPTRFQHDALGRMLVVEAPDDNSPTGFATKTTSYGFGEVEGVTTFTTAITDAKGNVRISHTDVDKSTVVVEEFNTIGGAGTTLATRYFYNPVNELERVVDAKGNPTNAKYDSVGRMVELTSLDLGRTEWRYDRGGNLGAKQTAQLRAKGQLVRYVYDFNRLRRIDYPETADVTYAYGGAAQKGEVNGNVAGRLIEEQSEAGSKRFKYDRLGNIVEHVQSFTRIRQPNQDPYTATLRYEFDSLGRMLKLRFPGEGAEEVTYAYDHGGLLTNIVGVNTEEVHPPRGAPVVNYLLHAGYDEFEQRTRIVFGNAVETRYKYDEKTRRLSEINGEHRDPTLEGQNRPARPFQRLRYVYDLVGNLTQIRNEAPFDDSMVNVFVGTTTQAFTYDDLYQLKTAAGIYQDRGNERARYSLEFAYDEIGNITLKDQGSFRDLPNPSGVFEEDHPDAEQTYRSVYQYAGPRPHAPTLITETLINDQVRPRELSYDASGNQNAWVYNHSHRREIDWTEEDRMRELREQGKKVSRVLYDGSGARAVHVDYFGNEETAYFDQHYTLRNAVYPTKPSTSTGNCWLASSIQAGFRIPPLCTSTTITSAARSTPRTTHKSSATRRVLAER